MPRANRYIVNSYVYHIKHAMIAKNLSLRRWALLTLLGSVFFREVAPAADATTGKPWKEFAGQFVEEYLAANPDFAVFSGRHEFDGKLPDWSPEGLKRSAEMLRNFRKQAAGFNLAQSGEERFERDYLVAR